MKLWICDRHAPRALAPSKHIQQSEDWKQWQKVSKSHKVILMHFGTLDTMTGTLVGPQAGSQDNWVALSSGNFSARLAILCTLQALQMCSQQRFFCRFGHRKSNYSEAKSEMVAKGHVSMSRNQSVVSGQSWSQANLFISSLAGAWDESESCQAHTLSGATGNQLQTELLQYLKKRGEAQLCKQA